MTWPRRRSKYGNKKTVVDGITFDSKAEARRYQELKLMERAGQVRGIELQPRFVIEVAGVKVCTYVADFRYQLRSPTAPAIEHWSVIVEDVKGLRTPTYRLKARLMQAVHRVQIHEWPPRERKRPARRRSVVVSNPDVVSKINASTGRQGGGRSR